MIQKKHKDRLFAFLFGREEYKENLLMLYNALNDKNYTNLDDLEINTIEDIIYLGYKNDVSCIFAVDEVMALYEQQSTYCPNMPLRGVFYFSKLYEKYVSVNEMNIYGSKKLKLPEPQYYVFYVGEKDMPERTVLKLSDMFDGNSKTLECEAIMLNINIDKNRELLEKCRPLYEYSYFVDNVYHYKRKYGNIELAIDKAINKCCEENILKDILIAHKSEVKDMILTEFDEAEYIEMVKKDAREEGREEGRESLIKDMLADDLIPDEVRKLIIEKYTKS